MRQRPTSTELHPARRLGVPGPRSTRRPDRPPSPATADESPAPSQEHPAFVLPSRLEAGQGAWHTHRLAQLIHPGDAVITVNTAEGLWVVPPARAVWVLPGVRHQLSCRRACAVNTLFVEPHSTTLPERCCVVAVDALVEQLLAASAAVGTSFSAGGAEERLIGVILDRLPRLAFAPLHLASPSDPRIQRITTILSSDPTDERTLDELATVAGLTARTAARLFLKETGLTFGEWRQQVRLFAALELLGAGVSVTTVALDVGYHDVSSFIHVFKASFGTTPAKYFQR